MVRVKRGFVARRRRNKLRGKAKGFRITVRTQFRRAKQAIYKAGTHATRHRKNKKREMRGLWIMRINAAARELGIKYNQLIAGLKRAKVGIDRKILANLAISDPKAFSKIIDLAKRS